MWMVTIGLIHRADVFRLNIIGAHRDTVGCGQRERMDRMWIDAGDQPVLPIDGVAGEHVNELNTVVCMRMRDRV